MQAPTLKRTRLNQIVGLALVVGLAASLALNVAMLTRSDNATAPMAAPQLGRTRLEKQQRYLDAKMARVDAMLAAEGAQYVPDSASYSGQKVFGYSGVGQVIVAQMLASQRFAPTAMDRFIIAAALLEGVQSQGDQSVAPATANRFDFGRYKAGFTETP